MASSRLPPSPIHHLPGEWRCATPWSPTTMVLIGCEMDGCWHDFEVIFTCNCSRQLHCDHCRGVQATAEFGPHILPNLICMGPGCRARCRITRCRSCFGPFRWDFGLVGSKCLAVGRLGKPAMPRVKAICRIHSYVELVQPVTPISLAEMLSSLAFQDVKHSSRALLAAAWGPHGGPELRTTSGRVYEVENDDGGGGHGEGMAPRPRPRAPVLSPSAGPISSDQVMSDGPGGQICGNPHPASRHPVPHASIYEPSPILQSLLNRPHTYTPDVLIPTTSSSATIILPTLVQPDTPLGLAYNKLPCGKTLPNLHGQTCYVPDLVAPNLSPPSSAPGQRLPPPSVTVSRHDPTVKRIPAPPQSIPPPPPPSRRPVGNTNS